MSNNIRTHYRVITTYGCDGDNYISVDIARNIEIATIKASRYMEMKNRGVISSEVYPITFIPDDSGHIIEIKYRSFRIRIIWGYAYVYNTLKDPDICQAKMIEGPTGIANTIKAIDYIDKYWLNQKK